MTQFESTCTLIYVHCYAFFEAFNYTLCVYLLKAKHKTNRRKEVCMFNKYNSPENQIIDTCQPVILVHEPFPHPHASGISSWHNQHTRIFKSLF